MVVSCTAKKLAISAENGIWLFTYKSDTGVQGTG